MDELVESLAAGFSVADSEGFNTNAPHPRFSQYKSRGYATNSQEHRREEWLREQQTKRSEQFDRLRNLEFDDVGDDDSGAGNEGSWYERSRRTGYVSKYFRDQLMLSEWLVDIPCDFAEKWIMVPCPEGKRALVTTGRGLTRAFTKSGYCFLEFSSQLPGGSRGDRKGSTLLDCIYDKANKTFFALDIMTWGNGNSIFDGETDFRFYFLRSKLEENEQLGQISRNNEYKFVGLPSCACSPKLMENMMTSGLGIGNAQLDGLLFYHSEAHYSSGQTPLVGWLKPFMLPEMLGVQIPERFKNQECPGQGSAEFIADFNQKEAAKKQALEENKKKRQMERRAQNRSSESEVEMTPLTEDGAPETQESASDSAPERLDPHPTVKSLDDVVEESCATDVTAVA